MRYAEPEPFTEPPAGGCTTRTTNLRTFVIEEFGADDLGCYSDRAVTGGARPSTHRDGRAVDSGFLHDEDARQRCFSFLVENQEALGVQMVLNYVRSGSSRSGRYWRLPRYDDETEPETGPFTKVGHWLHWEIHPSVADDATPIEELLAPPPPPPSVQEDVMRFVKLADDPAQFLQQGMILLWMTDGDMKGQYVDAFDIDPAPVEVTADELALCTLVGRVPHGDRVSIDVSSFANWVA